MDGIDAAIVSIAPEPGGKIELVGFRTFPYGDGLRAELQSGPDEEPLAWLTTMNVAVGEAFAGAARKLLAECNIREEEVLCIGSHGQTLLHLPEPREVGGERVRATLQIGEPSVIAERTGLTTVADFRARDMAAGGQGAPLVPLLDHRIYVDDELGRVALNIGGIANVTALPAAATLDEVRAFDTGPGNVLVDAAARRRGLEAGMDVGGALALAGAPDSGVLQTLLQHPFYAAPPPKSADIGDFLGDYAAKLWEVTADLADADLLATLAHLTARTIGDALDRWIRPEQAVDELIVSGGGAHNRAVVGELERVLSPAKVRAADEVSSIPGDAKEAVAFALLAHETLAGRPGSVASCTGAEGARVLGKIVPGTRQES